MKIPDINKLYKERDSFDNGLLRLPIDESTDLKKLGLKPYTGSEGHSLLSSNDKPCLVVRLVDLTSQKSIITRNPNQDIIEDRR